MLWRFAVPHRKLWREGRQTLARIPPHRQQAMLVTILSKTSIAATVRKQMIEVFDAVTRDRAPALAAPASVSNASAAAPPPDLTGVLAGIQHVLASMVALNQQLALDVRKVES